MRTFIQLRNNVGFATLHVAEGEPDHSVTPDDTTAIEVFTENADQFLGKKYDKTTNSWSSAPVITYGEFDETGHIIELRKTVFEYEAEGKPIFTSELMSEFRPDWKWIDGEWVKPYIDAVEEPAPAIEAPMWEATGPEN